MSLSYTTSTRRRWNSVVLLTTLAYLAGSGSQAGAVGYSWTNTAGGLWTTNGNWSAAGDPDDSGDTASLGDLSGAYVVTLNGARTIGGLTLAGTNPTLTLSNPLTIQGGTSTISGGTLNGTSIMRWTNGAVINWSAPTPPGGSVIFEVPDNQTITVNNTVGTFALGSGQTLRLLSSATGGTGAFTTFSNGFTNGGTIQLGTVPPGDNYGVNRLIVTSGSVTNSASGQIVMYPRSSTNEGAPWNTRELRAGIINSGTITSYTADGLLGASGQAITNSGTISTDHSIYTPASRIPKLSMVGTSFTNTGALTIGAGGGPGHILISNTTIDFNAGTTITGPGTLELAGNTVNINAGTSISGLSAMAFGRDEGTTTVNWGIADPTGAMTYRIHGGGAVVFNRTGAWNIPANQVLEFSAPDPSGGGIQSSLTLAEDVNNSGLVRMGLEQPGDNYTQANLILTGTKTFTNNVGATVRMLPRSPTEDSTTWNKRFINANVQNNGLMEVYASNGQLGGAGKSVINAATITVDSSLYTSPRKAQLQTLGTSFTNTGTINLNGGRLWLNSNTFNYNSGAINATVGSEIHLGSPGLNTNFIFNGGADITGPVSWFMKDGTGIDDD